MDCYWAGAVSDPEEPLSCLNPRKNCGKQGLNSQGSIKLQLRATWECFRDSSLGQAESKEDTRRFLVESDFREVSLLPWEYMGDAQENDILLSNPRRVLAHCSPSPSAASCLFDLMPFARNSNWLSPTTQLSLSFSCEGARSQ